MDCWTFHTPHGYFQIKENDDEYCVAYFNDKNLLGSFWRADQALEDLCLDFPGLPEDLGQWEYAPAV